MAGRLFLVVGPSGSGKDTLLDAAKEHFAGSEEVYFPKRYITRDEEAGGEDHIGVDRDKFELLRLQAQLAFYWDAHNLSYGIPHVIDDYLECGVNVVVNVSRSVIDYVRNHYDPVTVISITVNATELERRLRARGRESEEDITNRLARAQAFNITGHDIINIDNSGDLTGSIADFINVISKPRKDKKSA
jgi:phosphonate metabolism protein PhnN/1,5-bisphosphokinase (PRPP-forming)